MNRTAQVLAFVAAVLVVLAGAEAFIITIAQNREAQASPIRVACIGDSLTRGTEYTIDLWHLLGSGYVVGDFGVGGAAVYIDSGRAFINETSCQVAKDFQPDVVIIMLGTNDANPDLNEANTKFVSDYVALVSEFQTLASKPEVWLVEPPPIYENTVNISETLLTENVIPAIKETANQTGSQLIDAYTPLTGHPEYFLDGVHPDNWGAQLIANTVYASIIPAKTL